MTEHHLHCCLLLLYGQPGGLPATAISPSALSFVPSQKQHQQKYTGRSHWAGSQCRFMSLGFFFPFVSCLWFKEQLFITAEVLIQGPGLGRGLLLTGPWKDIWPKLCLCAGFLPAWNPFDALLSLEIVTEGGFGLVYSLMDGDSQLLLCEPFLTGGGAGWQLRVPGTAG